MLPLHITPARPADYAALAPFHYRAGPPATCVLALAARLDAAPSAPPAGILIVSCPTLNARWRAALWPGLFNTPDPRENARRINAQLRTISRVIVDPRFRGLGVATALVRDYLARPLTPRTEAVAAMGAFSGFFRAAGMREAVLRPTTRDRALLSALRAARVPRWRLIDPDRIAALPQRRLAHIDAALRRWANDSRATRAASRGPLLPLIELAARSIASPLAARAYAFDSIHC